MSYLELDKGRIEYAWFGEATNPASPTLVFLHHGTGSLSTWRDFPVRVAEATGYRAFVFSRFGYGRSSPADLPRPVHFMHDEALQVLPQIFERAQIKDAILIGHSDGASIALIYTASKIETNVRALILEAPHVFVEDLTIQSIAQAEIDYLQGGEFKEKLQRHHHENVDDTFWGWTRVWLNPEFRSWNIENCLPNIKCPVLVIQGEQEQFGTYRQVEAVSNQCAGTVKTIMLPDCNHTPHKEQPDLTFTAMKEFINSL